MAGIKSSIAFNPAGSGHMINANVNKTFGDLFRDLDFAIMADAEARRGLFSVQTDAMYTDVLQKGSRVQSVTGPHGLEIPISLGAELRLKMTVWTLSGGYDIFRNDRGFVQLFSGFRYLGTRSTLEWDFAGPLGNLARAGTVKSQSDIWNGIAGLRGEHALGEGPWKASYYADVGAGGSDLTYQGLVEFAYAKRWGDIGLGWRYLDFEQSGANATANLRMSGPIFAIRWRFGG
jgi:hypothetical protein